MVDFADVQVHVLTEEARKELNLEHRWQHAPSEAEVAEFEKVALKKKKNRFFEPLADW